MTTHSRIRGRRCGRAAFRCARFSRQGQRDRQGRATIFFPISSAVSASMRLSCATAMESAFGASDADGGWDWKTAYDACEAATVLFVRKFGPAMRARAASPAAMLPMLAKIAGLASHPYPPLGRERGASAVLARPSTLGLAASAAAAITPTDVVLEPSAGTGVLAILAELWGAKLALNELAETRAGLLSLLFPGIAVTRHGCRSHRRSPRHRHRAERRTDESAILGASPMWTAAWRTQRLRHISSALGTSCRWRPPGRDHRGELLLPDNPVWTDAFIRLQERVRIVFSAAIDGAVFAKHGSIRRYPSDRDRQGAGIRCGCIPGLTRYCARRRHVTRLGGRHRFRRGRRSLHPLYCPRSHVWPCHGRCAHIPCAHPQSQLRHRSPRRSNSPMRRRWRADRRREYHRCDL